MRLEIYRVKHFWWLGHNYIISGWLGPRVANTPAVPEDFVVSPFSTKTAVSHPIFTAMDSDEDSDEA